MKSTTIYSTIEALKTVGKNTLLILGGKNKNIDYSITGIISTVVQLSINILFIRYFREKSILIAGAVGSIVITLYALIRSKFFKYIKGSGIMF
mgnify:CR=1 FL=1